MSWADSWRVATLGALCAEGGGGVQTGPFGSQLHAADYVPVGVPSVMPQNIGDNTISADGIAMINAADAERLSKYRLRAGDIVYSRRGDVEKRAYVRPEQDGWLCGTGCLRVRLGEETPHDSRFISYQLGTEESRAWIVRHAVGATMPNLNTAILSGVPISVPALSEQQAIAEVLGVLDDKIAANVKLAFIIECLAETMFRELMSSATKLASVGSILTLEYGKPLPAGRRRNGAVAVYGSGGVVGSHDQALLTGPGVVVGRKGTAGAVHWAAGSFYPIDTTFYVVPSSEEYSMIFCYYALRSLGLDEMNSDSAVPGLNRNEAHAEITRIPEVAAMRAFGSTATVLFQQRAQLQGEGDSLAGVRDALLPLLMSGKIRVKEAAQMVGDVA